MVIFPAPFRAHLWRNIQKNLQLGFRNNDSSDVAPFHHDAATRSQVESLLVSGVFEPARFFGQPVRGLAVLSFSGVSVRG